MKSRRRLGHATSLELQIIIALHASCTNGPPEARPQSRSRVCALFFIASVRVPRPGGRDQGAFLHRVWSRGARVLCSFGIAHHSLQSVGAAKQIMYMNDAWRNKLQDMTNIVNPSKHAASHHMKRSLLCISFDIMVHMVI